MRDGPLREALWVSSDVTLAVAVIAAALPEHTHTTLVGFVFLAVTWMMVWRKDDETVRRHGLTLGGLVIPGSLRARELARAVGVSLAWSFGLLAIIAVPFFLGWREWQRHVHPGLPLVFSLHVKPAEAANEVLGQLFVIALPEEAFYRGYLQSRLEEAWPSPRLRLLGGSVGVGAWLVAAAIFAVGHLATVPLPTRLAVFFPALLFGWLRARTGGIGASMTFHMLCNVYSQLLGRGYGLY